MQGRFQACINIWSVDSIRILYPGVDNNASVAYMTGISAFANDKALDLTAQKRAVRSGASSSVVDGINY